jgi:PAS domain S-box-containing protein
MGATPWSRAFGGEQAPAAPQRPWPATLTVGTDGRITSWSRGAQALFGLSAGRACGRRMRTLMVRPEDRAALDELLGTVLAGRSWSGSLPLLDADGLVHPVECGWQPIQDRRGRPGALIVVTDRVGQSVPTARPAPLGTAEAALAAIGQFQEHAASVAMMRRVQLLTEANTMIGTTLDMAQTARELLNVAVPRFADTASVVLMESVVDEFELPAPRIEGEEIRVRQSRRKGPGSRARGDAPGGPDRRAPAEHGLRPGAAHRTPPHPALPRPSGRAEAVAQPRSLPRPAPRRQLHAGGPAGSAWRGPGHRDVLERPGPQALLRRRGRPRRGVRGARGPVRGQRQALQPRAQHGPDAAASPAPGGLRRPHRRGRRAQIPPGKRPDRRGRRLVRRDRPARRTRGDGRRRRDGPRNPRSSRHGPAPHRHQNPGRPGPPARRTPAPPGRTRRPPRRRRDALRHLPGSGLRPVHQNLPDGASGPHSAPDDHPGRSAHDPGATGRRAPWA